MTLITVIFFGKNDVSETYIEGMHVEYAKHGIKWGWNGPKAIVYIENTPDGNERIDFKEVFFKFKEDLAKQEAVQKERKEKEEKVEWYWVAIGAAFSLPVFTVVISWYVGKEIIESNEINQMQMQYAIALFLRDGLSKYIKQLSE